MLKVFVELLVAPALAAVATLAARHWGARAGGVVSAFPAIVGPVLLITALEHGPAFTARAADGTVLGLVALSGFALAYGWAAVRVGWRLATVCGWSCAALAATGAGLAAGGLGPTGSLLVAGFSLLLAHQALPSAGASPAPTPPSPARTGDIPARMALTAVLVMSLAAAASRLGPLVGGLLSALPVLASVLAVFTHRQHGAEALMAFLRGMLAGMAGFVAFCEVLALSVVRYQLVPAFLAATLAALIVQLVTAYAPLRAL